MRRNDLAEGNMTAFVKPPEPLIVAENMVEKWKQWCKQFHWYMIGTELNTKPQHVQAAVFMRCIGEDCARVFETFNLSAEQESSLQAIKQKFDDYFLPKACLTYERYVYNKIAQHDGEGFDQFLTRVKEQAKKCSFSVLHDSMVKDRLIVGTKYHKLVPQLLDDDLTLQRTIDKCRIFEQSMMQAKELQNPEALEVDAVKPKALQKATSSSKLKEIFFCGRCGTNHGRLSSVQEVVPSVQEERARSGKMLSKQE